MYVMPTIMSFLYCVCVWHCEILELLPLTAVFYSFFSCSLEVKAEVKN